MGRKYIHWGSSRFDLKAFESITNFEFLNKPRGGLWASPADAKYGWFEWSTRNDFYTDRLKKSFEFELSPDTRILEITPDNAWELPMVKDVVFRQIHRREKSAFGMVLGVDFEALAQEWDVLELSITKYPRLYWTMYGWDCDCILVLNPEVVVWE